MDDSEVHLAAYGASRNGSLSSLRQAVPHPARTAGDRNLDSGIGGLGPEQV